MGENFSRIGILIAIFKGKPVRDGRCLQSNGNSLIGGLTILQQNVGTVFQALDDAIHKG